MNLVTKGLGGGGQLMPTTGLANLSLVIDTGGGTGRRTKRRVPGATSNRAIALREDEDFIGATYAFIRRKH